MKISINISGKDYLFYDLAKPNRLGDISKPIDKLNASAMQDDLGDHFTLSEEGKQKYINYVQRKMGYSDSETDQVLKLSPGTILIDMGLKYEPTVKITMQGSDLRGRSFENPSNLLKKYTELYDEIVQGYQNGTRENYIDDPDAEYGWRRATLEDELALLNEDFENCLIGCEETIARNAVLREAIIKIARQLEKSGSGHLEFVGKAKKLENEPVITLPEDFKEKMRNAVKDFVSQYTKKFSQYGSVDVSKLLNEVQTKHLDFLKKDKK